MNAETTPITVTLSQGKWDTIRIALLGAMQDAHEKGKTKTLWEEMLQEAYNSLKDATF